MIKLWDSRQPASIYPLVEKVLKSGVYVKGPYVERFEKAWAKKCGMKYAVAVGSGAQALELAIEACFPFKEVPISYNSETFQAVPNAIERMERRPAPITPEFRVSLFAHHLHDHLLNYAPILEDCSHCHGYKPVAETAIFSLYPTKILGACGEAGVIVTNSEQVYEKCFYLRNHGIPRGTNARMDEVQAVILLEKLKFLDQWNSLRRQKVALYDSLLDRVTEGNFHYSYSIPGSMKLVEKLHSNGIETALHYDMEHLALPLYPSLSDKNIKKICKVILS